MLSLVITDPPSAFVIVSWLYEVNSNVNDTRNNKMCFIVYRFILGLLQMTEASGFGQRLIKCR